jgi:hypothetical protein
MITKWLNTILVMLLLFFVIIFVRSERITSDRPQINIFVPWGLIAIFISFYLFWETNRVWRAKRYTRKERINGRRQQLLENVIKAKHLK